MSFHFHPVEYNRHVNFTMPRLLVTLCMSLGACGDNGTSSLDLVGKSDGTKKSTPQATVGDAPRGGVFTVDLTQDIVFRHQRDGWNLKSEGAQVNVEKLRNGGVDVVLSALPGPRGEKAFTDLEQLIQVNRSLVDETDGAVRIVGSFSEAVSLEDDNAIAMMLLLEGADALKGRMESIPMLRRQGLAVVGLVGSQGNGFADSAQRPQADGGLTESGAALVRVLRENNIAVDLTHASYETFWDVLLEQTGAVAVTHTAVRALRDHPRNLDDLQILALLRYGGIMGLVFNPDLLKPGSSAHMQDVVAHVMHIKAIKALNVLVLGTDFDGIHPPAGLEDVSKLPAFSEALKGQGLSDDEIKKIFGDNARRFFEEVERERGAVALVRDDILRPIPIECDGAIGEFEGVLAASCNGTITDRGAMLEAGSRQKARLTNVKRSPVRLELFGDPGTPWQVEGQNLDGKVLFKRVIALDDSGNATVPLPQNRGLVRLFFSPTRTSGLREIVVWGR